jgi:hypothetical protein
VNLLKPSQRSFIWLIVLVLSMMLPSTVTANAKGEQLRRTMADIALLNSQMAQRKADAAGIRDALSARLAEIKSEAWREVREKGINTEADVLRNPRLLYDLMLMAEIKAYSERYSQKIGFYRVACDRLTYLYQQADDDLKIVSTLSDLKIDALVSQVEKVLDGYLPAAQTIVLQPGTLKIEPPEKSGNHLKKKNNSCFFCLANGRHQGPTDHRVRFFREPVKAEDTAVLQFKHRLVGVPAHQQTDQPLQKGQMTDQHNVLVQFERVCKKAHLIQGIHTIAPVTSTGGRQPFGEDFSRFPGPLFPAVKDAGHAYLISAGHFGNSFGFFFSFGRQSLLRIL